MSSLSGLGGPVKPSGDDDATLAGFDVAQLDTTTWPAVLDRTVKDACRTCKGTGRAFDPRNEGTDACDGCGGTGRVVQVEEDPEEAVTYFAFAGGELIDSGAKLDGFVEGLRKSWRESDDLAIWREREGDGLRLVAVIHPDGRGTPAVRWL